MIENNAQMNSKQRRIYGFRGWCTIFFRWAFIILVTVILAGGLYYRASWRVLVPATILLGILTVVPKRLRKYCWGAVGVVALAITIWIFVPEKSAGDWKFYSFDDELAALEAKRAVLPEHDAAL